MQNINCKKCNKRLVSREIDYLTLCDPCQIAQARIDVNLPPLDDGPRDCLKCGKKFWSIDIIKNRICDRCNWNNKQAEIGVMVVKMPSRWSRRSKQKTIGGCL